MLAIFKMLYKKVSFKVMDKLSRPFIFAYSAYVDSKVTKMTRKAGFDGCIESKLGPDALKEVIHSHVDEFVEKIIYNNLEN
mgnify:CR=1 FL=1